MTNKEDVEWAVELSVDFAGFVFYPESRRFVSYADAKAIVEDFKGKIGFVGVFVLQTDEEIKEVMELCSLDYAQVYRSVAGIENRIRVYRIKDSLPEDVESGLILFDTYTSSIGGSGVSFDVNLIKDADYRDRLFVAGGVNTENLRDIATLDVYGVDLVSSIEAYPGKKDFNKMKEFMEAVRAVK